MLRVSNSLYNIKTEKYTANNKVINLIFFGQHSYGSEVTPAHMSTDNYFSSQLPGKISLAGDTQKVSKKLEKWQEWYFYCECFPHLSPTSFKK